jgi:hypothetical protein
MSLLVYKAINNVQAALAVEGIGKNRTNTQGATYKFRGIDDVLNALAPKLAQFQLCILPRIISRECTERLSKSGGNLFYVTVEAEFDFVSTEDGSKHTVKTFGEAMDSSDKATNKAMSAAYKYAALHTFAIPTEGDHDTENNTHEIAPSTEDVETLYSELLIQAQAGGKDAAGRLWADMNPKIKSIINANTAMIDSLKVANKDWEIKHGTVG